MSISLTDAAASHISDQLQSRGRGLGVRVGVRTSGCSGLAYVLEFVDAERPGDKLVEAAGVKLFIDPKSLGYLDGSELDLVREGANIGLSFRNPNAKASCGCGESFTV